MALNNRYSLDILIEVDSEANFLELENGDNSDVIEELIKDMLYDLDDVKCLHVTCEGLD